MEMFSPKHEGERRLSDSCLKAIYCTVNYKLYTEFKKHLIKHHVKLENIKRISLQGDHNLIGEDI